MAEVRDPNVHRRRLGLDLRRGRGAVGLTQREAARRLEWSLSKLIRIESGAQGLSVTDLKAMLDLYGMSDPDQATALTEAARGSRGQAWWHPYRDIISPQFAKYLDHESQATSLRVFHPFLIPGLLHTEEYAASLMNVFREPEEQPRRAARITGLRAMRQERLFENQGTDFAFAIGEEALYRWVGGPRVMRRQLERLLEVGTRAKVPIRIVPFRAGSYAGLRGPFIVLQLQDGDDEVLFIESFSGDLLTRDEPSLISEYVEYFETFADLSLSPEEGNSLLSEQIDRLRDAEKTQAGHAG
jgi:transcriptional regulator with XRE-family HTH domain